MIGCLLDSFSYFIINKLPITFLLFFPFSCNSLTDTAQLHHIGNCLSRAHRVEYFPSITLLINKRIDDSSLSWTTLEGLLLLMLGWEFLALLIVIINVNIWDLWGTALCVSGSRWYIHHIRTLSCFWPTRYSNIYMEGMFLLLLPRTPIIAFWIWYFLPAHFSMVLILICHACLFSSPYSWRCNLFSHIESQMRSIQVGFRFSYWNLLYYTLGSFIFSFPKFAGEANWVCISGLSDIILQKYACGVAGLHKSPHRYSINSRYIQQKKVTLHIILACITFII